MINEMERNEFKQEVIQFVMAIVSIVVIIGLWSLLEKIHIS